MYDDSNKDDSLSTIQILFIISGCFVGLLLIVLTIIIIICCVRKCEEKKKEEDLEKFQEKTSILIEYDNPNRVFFPGAEVTGFVILTVREPVEIRSVLISLHGDTKTHFTVEERRAYSDSEGRTYTRYVTIHYFGSNLYEKDSTLWTPSSSKSAGFINTGTYRFPFSFLLPSDSPASFEGEYGFIQYCCVARFNRPSDTYDSTKKRMFSVVPLFDLNKNPKAIKPCRDTEEKTTGILCFKNRKIKMTVKMQKRGFVPGEKLALDFQIYNSTKKKIRSIEVTIVQSSEYVAFRGDEANEWWHGRAVSSFWNDRNPDRLTRSNERVVARSNEKVEIKNGENAKFTQFVRIPSTVPSFNNCPIISVEYFVKIKLTATGTFTTTVSSELPLIIGTIPFRQSLLPSDSQPPPLPLPSYTKCAFGDEDDTFVPRYAYYSNL